MPPLGLSCPVLRWTLDSVVVPVLARCKPGQTTACCPHYPPSPAITQHSPHNTHRSNAHHPPPTTHHPPPATRAACTHARTHTRSKQAASKQHTHTPAHTCVSEVLVSVYGTGGGDKGCGASIVCCMAGIGCAWDAFGGITYDVNELPALVETCWKLHPTT